MQDSQDNQRESIWSIRLLSLTRYYVVFGILFAIVTGLYVWQGFATAEPNSHPVGILLEAMRLASSSIPWLVVFTFYLVEGMNVLSERYLRSRYAKGRQEGLQEGREERVGRGRTEGPRGRTSAVACLEPAPRGCPERRAGLYRAAPVQSGKGRRQVRNLRTTPAMLNCRGLVCILSRGGHGCAFGKIFKVEVCQGPTGRATSGPSEGREEGLEEGEQKGREEERQQWLAWNQRREAALREGRDFTEPPPDGSQNGNGK